MKKIWLTGICMLFLLGCSNDIKETEPAITGEITQIEDGKILVKETLANGSRNEIWFDTNRIWPLKVGQHVSVWTNAVDESYPGQAEAEHIRVEEE